MKGTVQAIAPSLNGEGPRTSTEPGSLGGGGASQGGSSAATTAGPTSSMQISGPVNGTPVLVSSSKGALGLKNLQLNDDGVITSTDKEVKINNGTQMMIRAQISVPVH
jgi:hypothetical protein